MHNPIIDALVPHVRGSTPRPLLLSAYVSTSGGRKERGVILGFKEEDGKLTEIAAYRLSPDDGQHFAKYVDEARAWLESQAKGVPTATG
jgi:hypothetical protein